MVINFTAIQINSTSLSLSFFPPPFLIGVPITHYEININEGPTINISISSYTVHLYDPCISYTVSVSAWNIVGKGNGSIISNITLYQSELLHTYIFPNGNTIFHI